MLGKNNVNGGGIKLVFNDGTTKQYGKVKYGKKLVSQGDIDYIPVIFTLTKNSSQRLQVGSSKSNLTPLLNYDSIYTTTTTMFSLYVPSYLSKDIFDSVTYVFCNTNNVYCTCWIEK